MKSAVHCHLLLPGLDRETAARAQCPPALRTLLRYARRMESFAEGTAAWQCRFFGVARQQDWPSAPFAALGEGLPAGNACWFSVSPIHLLLQRDSFVLADIPFKELTQSQAQALVDALNAHFSEDGMRFFAPRANRWYVRMATLPRMETIPLAEAMGRDVQPLLPRGADALRWHGWLNEVQMLLHQHPVNLELEQEGGLTVNSLWLWGGGVLPPCGVRDNLAVFAHDPVTRGLAQAHGCPVASLPVSAGTWLEAAAAQSEQLVVTESLPLSDPQPALDQLDAQWLAPLLGALRRGNIARLTLHAASRHVHSLSLTRSDLRKFWRRPPAWEHCFG